MWVKQPKTAVEWSICQDLLHFFKQRDKVQDFVIKIPEIFKTCVHPSERSYFLWQFLCQIFKRKKVALAKIKFTS